MDLDLLVKRQLGMEPPEEEREEAYSLTTAEDRHVAAQLGLLDNAGRSGTRRLSIATLSREDLAHRTGLSPEDLAVAGQLGLAPDELLQEVA